MSADQAFYVPVRIGVGSSSTPLSFLFSVYKSLLRDKCSVVCASRSLLRKEHIFLGVGSLCASIACTRVAWREDGRRLASASDDRTVRVWGLEGGGGGGDGARYSGSEGKGQGEGSEGSCGDGRGHLLWTGWGHASRVWDIGFTKIGVVSCGEVRQTARGGVRGKPVDGLIMFFCSRPPVEYNTKKISSTPAPVSQQAFASLGPGR